MNFANGDEYDGEWVADRKCGKGRFGFDFLGIYNYSNGDRYEGDLLDDKKHGKGKARSNCRNPRLLQR